MIFLHRNTSTVQIPDTHNISVISIITSIPSQKKKAKCAAQADARVVDESEPRTTGSSIQHLTVPMVLVLVWSSPRVGFGRVRACYQWSVEPRTGYLMPLISSKVSGVTTNSSSDSV